LCIESPLVPIEPFDASRLYPVLWGGVEAGEKIEDVAEFAFVIG
jgi:hypothetical protein